MDGAAWELVADEDFTGDPEAFRNRCYAVAARHDKKATVQKRTDDDGRAVLIVCFFDDPDAVADNGAGPQGSEGSGPGPVGPPGPQDELAAA